MVMGKDGELLLSSGQCRLNGAYYPHILLLLWETDEKLSISAKVIIDENLYAIMSTMVQTHYAHSQFTAVIPHLHNTQCQTRGLKQ